MESAAISGEEFQRLQEQLIELRTQNYEMTNKVKRHAADSKILEERCQVLERDLEKAQKVMMKSKKSREVAQVYEESERLQGKLAQQEEEFRLQNETIMRELAKVISENERLSAAAPSRDGDVGQQCRSDAGSGGRGGDEDVRRRLLAENMALREQLRQSKVQRGDDEESGVPPDEVASRTDGGDVTAIDDPTTRRTPTPPPPQAQQHTPAAAHSAVGEDLSLQILQEEHKLLRQEYDQYKNVSSAQMTQLQQQLEHTADKLRRKQDILVQVQNEKEQQYTDSRAELERVEESKERECRRLMLERDEATDNLQRVSAERAECERTCSNMKESIARLEARAAEASSEQCQELQSRAEQLSAQVQSLTEQLKTSEVQLCECREQLGAVSEERDRINSLLHDCSKVADKRKAIIDEMAIKLSAVSESHKGERSQLVSGYEGQIGELRRQVDEERVRQGKVDELVGECTRLADEVRRLDESKQWLQRQLTDTEHEVVSSKAALESELSDVRRCNSEHIDQITSDHNIQIQALKGEVEESVSRINELEQSNSRLRQEIKDMMEERKIFEKNSSSSDSQGGGGGDMSRKLQRMLEETLTKNMHLQQDMERLSEELVALRGPSGGGTGEESPRSPPAT